MDSKETDDELEREIERDNFVRAAHLASSLGVEEDKLRDIRLKALWQMAAVNRNLIGTLILAKRYRYSKEEVKKILKNYSDNESNSKALKSQYDPRTGKYLSFNEWMDALMKNWSRLSA